MERQPLNADAEEFIPQCVRIKNEIYSMLNLDKLYQVESMMNDINSLLTLISPASTDPLDASFSSMYHLEYNVPLLVAISNAILFFKAVGYKSIHESDQVFGSRSSVGGILPNLDFDEKVLEEAKKLIKLIDDLTPELSKMLTMIIEKCFLCITVTFESCADTARKIVYDYIDSVRHHLERPNLSRLGPIVNKLLSTEFTTKKSTLMQCDEFFIKVMSEISYLPGDHVQLTAKHIFLIKDLCRYLIVY